jgi:hypothetical protein
MSNILDGFTIATMPGGGDHCANHIRNGNKVAITEVGLHEHNEHNMLQNIFLGAGIAAVAVPVAIGGGIGVVMGGEAFGLGILEQVIAGGAAGGISAKAMDKPRKGYIRDDKHNTLSLIDMVGTVTSKQPRWWDQPGHDVHIKWIGADEFGNRVAFDAWHNPEHLVTLVKK